MKKLLVFLLLSGCTTYKVRVVYRNDGVILYTPMQRKRLQWKEHWYTYHSLNDAKQLINVWKVQNQKQKEQYIRIR